MQGWFRWKFLYKMGFQPQELLSVLGRGKLIYFPLHAFIPLLKCNKFCLENECFYSNTSFWLSLNLFSSFFHLVLVGIFILWDSILFSPNMNFILEIKKSYFIPCFSNNLGYIFLPYFKFSLPSFFFN